MRLELERPSATYLLGEPIDLQLVFPAHQAGYRVDTARYLGVHDRVNVTPQTGTLRWQAEDSSGEPHWEALADQPVAVEIRVNDVLIFRSPGRYLLSVTTPRLGYGDSDSSVRPVQVTSNTVAVRLLPMSEQEEAARVATLTARLALAHGDTQRERIARDLACLTGDAAARAKVRLYLDPWQGVAVRQAMVSGLAISLNKPLELALLDQAWQATDRIPSEALLTEMVTLRQLDAGLPLSSSTPLGSERWAEAVAEEHEVRTVYLDEIGRTLPRRDPENRAQTEAFIRRMTQPGP